jgi:hypothetical protein
MAPRLRPNSKTDQNQLVTSDEADRLLRAKDHLRALFATEFVLVKAEAIARLGERYHSRDLRNIDSHVTGRALNEMRLAGEIVIDSNVPSRGGHLVDTLRPADTRRRKTVIAAAARRKRALYARYLSWANSTRRYPNGFLGPAGEAATRAAIIASAALQPAAQGAGPVSQLLGVRLPGAADSAGFMSPLIGGIPQPAVTVIFEVKNIRDWIYPSNFELFQVLRKGIVLQQARPEVPIVPILVCRKAQITTFYMAQQLGFLVIEMGAQFVGTHATESAVRDVRNGLGFVDLRHGNGPSVRVHDRLNKHYPPILQQYASTWAQTALDNDIAARISRCGQRSTSARERFALLDEVRRRNLENGNRGGW